MRIWTIDIYLIKVNYNAHCTLYCELTWSACALEVVVLDGAYSTIKARAVDTAQVCL